MIHVWYSNSLERLADTLVENLSRPRAPFPACVFENACLVVPNGNVIDYLKFEIARATGIAANLEFHFLEEFINELITSGRLPLSGDGVGDGRMAYHDPCYLGRYNEVYDQPRNVMDGAAGGYVELPRCRAGGRGSA